MYKWRKVWLTKIHKLKNRWSVLKDKKFKKPKDEYKERESI